MTPTEIDELLAKTYYPVISEKTGRLYLDEGFRIYLFEADALAQEFCDRIKNAKIGEETSYTMQDLASICARMGAKTTYIMPSRADEYAKLDIDTRAKKLLHYNGDAVKKILLLKETKKKKYLRAMCKDYFVAPMEIAPREYGTYPYISHVIAQGGKAEYIPLFSDLQEFLPWNEKMKNEFFPHAVTIADLKENMEGEHPIIINPESDRLILSTQMIEIGLKEAKKGKKNEAVRSKKSN